MTQLSRNFSLAEMIYSTTAKKYKIDNTPDATVIENLRLLCTKVLQPVRDKFGIVTITSGYRSTSLNRKVNGKNNSQHLFGQAADIQLPHAKLQDVFDYIKNNLDFDQLLFEKSKTTKWIHVSYKKTGNRRYFDKDYKV